MDREKCRALKKSLFLEPEPQIIPIDRFFDGNDDIASIGCNLMQHPGMDTFRATFEAVGKRSDVEAIYAGVAELDPGEDYWPFADTVFVVGDVPPRELRTMVKSLEPDEVWPAEQSEVPEPIRRNHDAPVLAVWWD
jgi:hypothetical protein